jgi:hypothetical protein
MVQVGEHLPGKSKPLSSTPAPKKKRKKQKTKLGLMVHVCNSSYTGGSQTEVGPGSGAGG